MSDAIMEVWVVYQRPMDMPECEYVLRRQVVMSDGNIAYDLDFSVADTLMKIREHIPPGKVRLGRSTGDDPKIVETWI